MSKVIYILNGPNLNLLGQRQPELYGAATLADVEAQCTDVAAELSLEVRMMQSNSEGQLIDWVQEARKSANGVIINPGGYSHTSIALMDALLSFDGPILEVHVSNIHRRDSFRHHSFVSQAANGVIAGFGVNGYQLALRHMATLLG